MFTLSFTIFLILAIIFLTSMTFERRGLHIGWIFMMTGIAFLFWIVGLAGEDSSSILYQFAYFLGLGILATMFILPGAIVISFFYSAVMILRREGMGFRNMLSLTMGVLVLGYIFIWPLIGRSLPPYSIFNFIYIYIGAVILYLILLGGNFTLSSILNSIHILPAHLDYIIVLGAGLNGEKVTPLLASRINRGIALYHKNPTSKLIMSGGQGSDEVISEAEAMYRYAVSQGVPKEDILRETQSKNTDENIRFSMKIIGSQRKKIAIVTNFYHLFRALLIARKEKVSCIGYGAKTKFYFSVNAFIREFVGYLVLTKKWHLFWLISWTILFILLVATSLAYDLGLLTRYFPQ